MDIKEGLHDYQLILIILGVILFMVLIFLLIYNTLKKRPLKSLFLFFILPILMIGYPAIQKIRFENGVVEVEKAAEKSRTHPTPENKKALEAKINELKKQPNVSESTMKQLAHLRTELISD
jgi:hypothetical protein